MNDTTPIHKRTLIGNALIQAIKGHTTAGNNVAYAYTPKPTMTEMPMVLIYPQSEQIDELSQAPRELRRNLFMTVECIADGDTDEDMVVNLDTLADQVEQLIGQDDSLDCTVDDIILNSVDFQFEGDANESPIGSVRMAYLIKYREYTPREQVNVDDFDSMNTKWDISPEGAPDGIVEAEDIIKLDNE